MPAWLLTGSLSPHRVTVTRPQDLSAVPQATCLSSPPRVFSSPWAPQSWVGRPGDHSEGRATSVGWAQVGRAPWVAEGSEGMCSSGGDGGGRGAGSPRCGPDLGIRWGTLGCGEKRTGGILRWSSIHLGISPPTHQPVAHAAQPPSSLGRPCRLLSSTPHGSPSPHSPPCPLDDPQDPPSPVPLLLPRAREFRPQAASLASPRLFSCPGT